LAVAIVRVQPSKPTKHHVDTRSLCASRALRRHLYHSFVLLYIIKLITLKLNKLCRTRNADPQSGANLSMKSNNTTASSSYTLAEKRRRTRSTPPPHVIWTHTQPIQKIARLLSTATSACCNPSVAGLALVGSRLVHNVIRCQLLPRANIPHSKRDNDHRLCTLSPVSSLAQ
jgi:hypothetical protein